MGNIIILREEREEKGNTDKVSKKLSQNESNKALRHQRIVNAYVLEIKN